MVIASSTGIPDDTRVRLLSLRSVHTNGVAMPSRRPVRQMGLSSFAPVRDRGTTTWRAMCPEQTPAGGSRNLRPRECSHDPKRRQHRYSDLRYSVRSRFCASVSPRLRTRS
jgi:hypothetical protein